MFMKPAFHGNTQFKKKIFSILHVSGIYSRLYKENLHSVYLSQVQYIILYTISPTNKRNSTFERWGIWLFEVVFIQQSIIIHQLHFIIQHVGCWQGPHLGYLLLWFIHWEKNSKQSWLWYNLLLKTFELHELFFFFSFGQTLV